MTTNPKFALGATKTYTPLATDLTKDPIVQSIHAAAKGAQNTTTYFDVVNQYSTMYGLLQSGGAWLKGKDSKTGLPMFYLSSVDEKKNNYYISVQYDQLNFNSSGKLVPNGDTQTIKGKTYQGIGLVNHTIGFNEGPIKKITMFLGTSLDGLALEDPKQLLSDLLESVSNRLAGGIGKVAKPVPTDPDTTDDDIDAADAEASEGVVADTAEEVIVEDAAVEFGTYFFGLGIAVGVVLTVLSFLMHSTSHRIRVWNLTSYTLKWASIMDSNSIMVSGPVNYVQGSKSRISSYDDFPPVQQITPTPQAKPENQATYADISMNSSSEIEGISYAFQFNLVKSGENSNYTASVMFDVPLSGDNSTSVSLDSTINLQAWFDSQKGVNQSTLQTTTSSDKKITLSSSYDFLAGEHPIISMKGGETNEGDFYNSVILITEVDLDPSKASSTSSVVPNWLRRRQERAQGLRAPLKRNGADK